jgi:hypothetical protein
MKGKPLPEVLSAGDIAVVCRAENPILMSYLVRKETLSQLFHLLASEAKRDFHRKVIPLLETSNMGLFSPIARRLDVAEEAFDLLKRAQDGSDPKSLRVACGIGTISLLVSWGLDRWPEEICELLRSSDKLDSLVITNLDMSVVYQTMNGLLVESHAEVIEFLFHVFKAVTSIRIKDMELPQRLQFIKPCAITLDEFPKGTRCKQVSLDLLRQFFKLPGSEDFKTLVVEKLAGIIETNWIDAYFDVAQAAGPNQRMKEAIMRELAKGRPERWRAAIPYLAVCVTHCKW